MLILSRRKAEKVLFPNLGITVEVTRIRGRTVHLGIDAPDEIRIIRAELETTADLSARKPPRVSYQRRVHSSNVAPAIQECLDAAHLAIHLAQNQLRQQLNDRAEEALENALECLESLGRAVVQNAALASTSASVREAKTRYQRISERTRQVVDENNPRSNERKYRLDGQGQHHISWLAESGDVDAITGCFA